MGRVSETELEQTKCSYWISYAKGLTGPLWFYFPSHRKNVEFWSRGRTKNCGSHFTISMANLMCYWHFPCFSQYFLGPTWEAPGGTRSQPPGQGSQRLLSPLCTQEEGPPAAPSTALPTACLLRPPDLWARDACAPPRPAQRLTRSSPGSSWRAPWSPCCSWSPRPRALAPQNLEQEGKERGERAERAAGPRSVSTGAARGVRSVEISSGKAGVYIIHNEAFFRFCSCEHR